MRIPTKVRRFFRSRHFRTLLKVGAAGCLLGLLVFAVAWWRICAGDSCPSADALEEYVPRQTSKVYAADGRLIGELGLERRTIIRVTELPQSVRDAFLLTEDKRFYSHNGIDFIRVVGAAIRNVRSLSFSEGFSTITMQLARNVFPERLSREKTLTRKLKEMKVARRIERQFDKDRIFELYLNQIAFGNGAHGIETAARRYFGKSARELNVAEAALLAGLPKAPTRYDPHRYPDRAIQRRNVILELLHENGALDDAHTSLAKAWPLQLARGGTGSADVAPYFVEMVRQQLQQRFGSALYAEGFEIHTTLDLDLQIAAERGLEAQLRNIEAGQAGTFEHASYEQYLARAGQNDDATAPNSPYLQGAFVAIEPRTGAVRALIGGRDFNDSKFNRATQALRQPGSTFKPIVYATALRFGKPASHVLEDEPLTMMQMDGTEWAPQNYDLTFQGPMPLRRALYLSRNLPAIRLGMEVGEANVVEMARRFGISSPILPVPAIHIGAADVYPIEMVNAYSVFANLGWRARPNTITRVLNSRGQIVWQPEPATETVLSLEEAWLMTDMLRDVIRRGTAHNAVWGAGFHLPAGGKTGTTNGYADVWFIGFTADLVTGVWMGFDRPVRIMDNAQGGRLAAPAWTAFMLEAYRRKPAPTEWPRPRTLIPLAVDGPTGLRRGLCGADRAAVEWFIPGTEPTDICLPGLTARQHRVPQR